ncbi:MAG: endonuclease Q family protein [Elusimicrobiota bacterium]
MRFIGDFHIHSHYSIATSRQLVPEMLAYRASIKGIKVIGTGDFTHPGWLDELSEKLIPAEQGLFRLKDEYKVRDLPGLSENSSLDTRFMLTAEINNIYRQGGKVRKVHNLIFVPSFDTARKIQKSVSRFGRVQSDGRPVLSLDSRHLLEISLESSPEAFFVPAHIWTPWFSVLGAKSGFDSIDECYGDLSRYIYAVETGLSSDPAMNRLCSFLDRFTLISNSDAHSPEKLGREANLFDTEISYGCITEAIRNAERKGFLGTIEFFPEGGKYYYDGHRKCGISWAPEQTGKNSGICPVCSREVTCGVMNRVLQLADRKDDDESPDKRNFYSLIPLKEILSEILGTGQKSLKVSAAYDMLTAGIGSEFAVLLEVTVEELERIAGEAVTEAIRRMRNKEIYIKEGFDGQYGEIRLFDKNEIDEVVLSARSFFKNRINI